jgi:hypothetical protein
MKPILVFVLAFVVAAAGGTGAKVMMTKPDAKAGADSAKADSTKSDSAKGEGAKHGGEGTPTDTAVQASGEPSKAPADSAHSAAAVSISPLGRAPAANAAAAGAAPTTPFDTTLSKRLRLALALSAKPAVVPAGEVAPQKIAPPAAPGAPKPATPDTVERRIAKVFTSMDPKQAGKVLEHMSDGDVGVILGYVGVKQAAAILAALPPERVAKLSKLAMDGAGK